MSQAKVDKHKEEKKNREKLIKKARRKKVAAVFLCAAIIGGIIGYPLGRHIYNVHQDKLKENAVVEASNLDYWFGLYWGRTYADLLSTSTDADFSEDSDVDSEEGDIVELDADDLTGTASDAE